MEKDVIGKKLKEYRKNNDRTQSDMAKMFDVSLTAYQMWERAVSEPNEENMIKVKHTLNL